ncbi:MAG: sulfatase-like hydrolase/transferase, partial [Salibacteraceae bacterium]
TSNPAFYTLFSISSHHPFNIPDSLKSLFLSDEHKYYQALHYSDWSLGQFFEKSKKKKWFKNTIFIVVADHTLNGESFSQEHQKRAKNWYQNRVGLYSIPILFYNPNFEVSRTVTTPFSQVDVAASILEIAGYTGSTISWGTPTSALSYENYCFEFVNGIYQIHNEQHVVLFDGQNSLGIFDFMTDITFDNDLRNNENLSELHDLMLYKLKGAIQQHHARMVQNRLFVKE